MMSASRAISTGEMTQLDPPKIRQRDVGPPLRLAAALVDLRLDRPHLLVSDHQEIAGAAGGVENP